MARPRKLSTTGFKNLNVASGAKVKTTLGNIYYAPQAQFDPQMHSQNSKKHTKRA